MKSTTNAVSTTVLCIADVVIRQDEEGRYCLNDLHKAAGSELRHRPVEFLRSKQAKELIELLESEGDETVGNDDLTVGIPTVKSVIPTVKTVDGRSGGTYAVLEVVVAYANWISAAFHLKVIRTFIAVQSGKEQHNLVSEVNISEWRQLFNSRTRLMNNLAKCDDLGVAQGLYTNVLRVSLYLGMATEPLHSLCPGVRKLAIAFELDGGAA